MIDKEDVRNVRSFYELLSEIEIKIGGKQILAECDGNMPWPERGVYFFFEPGENRSTSGNGLRCVRVGTHTLTTNNKSTLWKRLRKHKGTESGSNPGGGNHRQSVFRKHVGLALIAQNQMSEETAKDWACSRVSKKIKDNEAALEQLVSEIIRSMPFIWLEIDDEPGPKSDRGYIERNSIALLSNYHRENNPIDPPSQTWLGRCAKSDKVRSSGLWNSNHVKESVDKDFLVTLKSLIS